MSRAWLATWGSVVVMLASATVLVSAASATPGIGAKALVGQWVLPVSTVAEGGRVNAVVKLRSGEPLHDVVVTLTSTGRVSLGVPARRLLGEVASGSNVDASFTVTGDGTGTIHATLTGFDSSGSPVHAATDLDFATGAHRAALSLGGLLRARVAALAFERASIGGPTYQRRLAALLGGGATEHFATSPAPAPERSALSATTTVSGKIMYTAGDGGVHPARTIAVEIRDNQGFGKPVALVASTTTDASGNYSVTVPTLRLDNTARRLFVRALAKSTGFAVRLLGQIIPQHIDSSVHVATGAPLTVDLTANRTDDNNTAFDVADALVTAVQYTLRINGGQIFHNLTVSFPDPMGTDFNHNTFLARVLKLDRFDWDVILHEYGHFTAGVLGFDTSLGGRHRFTDNLGEPTLYGKDDGTRLAWSEGFATYFAISAEDVLKVKFLGIPRAGDTFYDDTEDATFHVDLQTNSSFASLGEDNELSVARALWHFFKDPKLGMSDTLIISTLKAAAADTLSKAVAALLPAGGAAKFDDTQPIDATKVAHSNDFACVLTDQAVSSQITAPADGTHAMVATPQTFTWTANGAGPSNRLDKFTVQFWSENWDTLIYESTAILSGTTFTPSLSDWQMKILGGKDKSGNLPAQLNVVIKGKGTNTPVTGPYKSCKITEPVDPSIKATPVEATLASFPTAPACSGSGLPSDINQFTLDGMRLKPNTVYALKFTDTTTGYPDVALGNVTSDANGLVSGKRIIIPLMPGKPKWLLIATPSTGAAPSTLVSVGFTTCISFNRAATDFPVQWGGAGVKPASTVTESWNGVREATTIADSKGAYQGSYTIHCPMASNTVQAAFTALDGTGTLTFAGVPCVPGATDPTLGPNTFSRATVGYLPDFGGANTFRRSARLARRG